MVLCLVCYHVSHVTLLNDILLYYLHNDISCRRTQCCFRTSDAVACPSLAPFLFLVAVFEVDVITVLVSGMTVKVYVVCITTYWFILING